MKKTALVIGGGIIGLCTAHQLQESGWQVTLLDKNPAPAPTCSTVNGGMIVPSHFTPLAAPGMVALGLRYLFNPRGPFRIQPSLSPDLLRWLTLFMRHCNPQHVAKNELLLRDLNLVSRALYVDLKSTHPLGIDLVENGLYAICAQPETLHHEAKLAARANELGLRADVLTAQDLQAAEPDLTINSAGAVIFRDDAHFSPHQVVNLFRDLFIQAGGTIRYETTIHHLETASGKVTAALSSTERFTADEVILTGGAVTAKLARTAGLRFPLMPGKGYSLHVPIPSGKPAMRGCAVLVEARVAVTPMTSPHPNGVQSGIRFAGTMEIGDFSDRISQPRVEGIATGVTNAFPEFQKQDLLNQKVTFGHRPCSPDGLPFIGRTRRAENLTIATGHGMMGMSLGPVTGVLTAAAVNNQDHPLLTPALSPDRFS